VIGYGIKRAYINCGRVELRNPELGAGNWESGLGVGPMTWVWITRENWLWEVDSPVQFASLSDPRALFLEMLKKIKVVTRIKR
jgi:hypothetical protein